MLDTPTIIQTEPTHLAKVHVLTPRNKIQEVMGPAITKVFGAVLGQGRAPTGPWFTHHLRVDPEIFEFEACVPTDAPVLPSEDGVVTGHWPRTRVARVIYAGPYEGLSQAWPEFKAWAEANDLKARGDVYERYLVGPDTVTDPADYRTELMLPLV